MLCWVKGIKQTNMFNNLSLHLIFELARHICIKVYIIETGLHTCKLVWPVLSFCSSSASCSLLTLLTSLLDILPRDAFPPPPLIVPAISTSWPDNVTTRWRLEPCSKERVKRPRNTYVYIHPIEQYISIIYACNQTVNRLHCIIVGNAYTECHWYSLISIMLLFKGWFASRENV